MNFTPARSRPRPLAGSLTSLIDVVFLLLVFFILTARFGDAESALRAGLAAESGDAPATPLEPVLLRAHADGSFTLGTRRVARATDLAPWLRELPKATGVVVSAEPAATMDAVVAALQAAHDAGFENRTYLPNAPTP